MINLETGTMEFHGITISPDSKLSDFRDYPSDQVAVLDLGNGCGSVRLVTPVLSYMIPAEVRIHFNETLGVNSVFIIPKTAGLNQMSRLDAMKLWLQGAVPRVYTEMDSFLAAAYEWGYICAFPTEDRDYETVGGELVFRYGCLPALREGETSLNSAEYLNRILAQEFRLATRYSCPDDYQMATIQDEYLYLLTTDRQHTWIVDRSLPEKGHGISGHYTDQATVDACLMGKGNVCNGKLNNLLQNAPYQTDINIDPAYRLHLDCFRIDRAVWERLSGSNLFRTAVGVCTANNQFGKGGGHQGFNPHIANMIRDGILVHDQERSFSDPVMSDLDVACLNKGVLKNSTLSMEAYEKMMLDAEYRTMECVLKDTQHPTESVLKVTGCTDVPDMIPGVTGNGIIS